MARVADNADVLPGILPELTTRTLDRYGIVDQLRPTFTVRDATLPGSYESAAAENISKQNLDGNCRSRLPLCSHMSKPLCFGNVILWRGRAIPRGL